MLKQWSLRFDRVNAKLSSSLRAAFGQVGWLFVVRLPGQQSVSMQVQTCAAR